MPASTIIVQYKDGSPASHVRVVLGFSSGLTRDFYTNEYGEVTIEHSSVGRAEIYVSGKKVGTFHAPGRTAVTI